MKRYNLRDNHIIQESNGEFVRYVDALAQQCPQDSQEGFRAFLARRGIGKFHSLYGTVLCEIDKMEDEYKGLMQEWKDAESIRNGELMREHDERTAQLENANVLLRAVLEHLGPAIAMYEKGIPEHPVIANIRLHLK